MSEEEIRKQIAKREAELYELEKNFIEQKKSAELELEKEYGSKIQELRSKVALIKVELHKLNAEIRAYKRQKDNFNAQKTKEEKKLVKKEVKELEKEIGRTNKNQVGAFFSKLKQIEYNKKVEIKQIQAEIKALNKQFNILQKMRYSD